MWVYVSVLEEHDAFIIRIEITYESRLNDMDVRKFV
jgi:hypothetical protein